MKTTPYKTPVITFLVVSLVLGLCGCCCENQSNCEDGMKLNPIYGAVLTGALVGGVIGHQSDETGEGVAIGAVVLGVGELLNQIDKQAEKEWEHENGDECTGPVVVEIHNSNGSITTVKIKKEGSVYIGPKGEHYQEMPTEKQLKPIYGL
jgi:hypothetical protein